MAEVTAFRNNAVPYPVYGLPWGVVFPILDNTGALVSGAAGLDSEVSLNGDTFADCTNEATEIGSSGMYYLLLTGAEMTASVVTAIVKTSTTDAKTTPMVFNTKAAIEVRTGTSQGAAFAYTITLDAGASSLNNIYSGMVIVAVIDGVTQVRMIHTYDGSTKIALVSPAFTTTPDSDDTFGIYLIDAALTVQQANMLAVSEDAAAADAFETMLDGTGGNVLSLKQLNVVNNAGSAVIASSTGSNGHGIAASGNGSGEGVSVTGGATGNGMEIIGGATSGGGLRIQAPTSGEGMLIYGGGNGDGLLISAGTSGTGLLISGASNGAGILAAGSGSGAGIRAVSGATGIGLHLAGGATSGDGMKVEAAGSGLDINAPNSDIGGVALSSTGVTAVATGVWASGTRTLTSFGTLVADVATAVWGAATRILTAGTNIVLAKGVGLTGLNDLSQADVRSAVGMASADLDTQLNDLGAAIVSRATPAQVKTQIVDALSVDTYAEPTGAPPATATIERKVGQVYMALRNGLTVTATQKAFKDDSGATEWSKALSDNGTTYTEGEGS